jgi:hypothetical protein
MHRRARRTEKEKTMNPVRKALVGGALVAATITGGAAGATLFGTASAQTSSTTAPSSSTAAPAGAPAGAHDPSKGGHVANGVTEAVLTGDTADKVKAAALAAVPGGTVQRVENDAEGSPYEAHMTTADGKQVTVKVDASFKVTSTGDGFN